MREILKIDLMRGWDLDTMYCPTTSDLCVDQIIENVIAVQKIRFLRDE